MDNQLEKYTILIVDDHQSVLVAISQLLEESFEKVIPLSDPHQIIPTLSSHAVDAVLLDMNFSAGADSGEEGLDWLQEIHQVDSNIMVIMMTAYGEIDLAVKAIQLGARDFIVKPWDNEKLLSTLRIACELRHSNLALRTLIEKQKQYHEIISGKVPGMIGKSPVIQAVYDLIKRVGPTDAEVLVTGENGTGKDLVAKELHKNSKRNNEILLTVDLGSISETLFESEMFGHIKGAFTDAKTSRTGKFEAASGGTIFLDEVGNLSLSSQAKLLSTLQNKVITPVGSNKRIPVDFRLIAATNKNLMALIKDGLFREDLYYRLNTIEVHLPPLRDRGDDILALAHHFLKLYKAKYEKPLLKLNADTERVLLEYSWPGNVRELKHTIEKAVILCTSNILKPSDLFIPEQNSVLVESIESRTLENIEKQAILASLRHNHGNITGTAKELGLARQTLYNKINKYKI